MEHVSSVRPTGKFPEKVENRKRWSRFPGWNFRTECRVPLTFLVVCTSSRSTVGHPATYRGLRPNQPNGTTFYQSEIPLLLPPKFPVFFRKWKAPEVAKEMTGRQYPLNTNLKKLCHVNCYLYIKLTGCVLASISKTIGRYWTVPCSQLLRMAWRRVLELEKIGPMIFKF